MAARSSSPLRKATCRSGSGSCANASSHWSTTSTVSGLTRTAVSSSSRGCAPGVTTRTRPPLRSRVAATPARTREDLPQPDGPTTASTPASRSRSRQASRSRSRPKNTSGVLHLVGQEPRVGTGRGRRRQRLLDESGVLRQDRPLELDELRAGVHSELPRQHRPHLAEGPQRLGLATGLVLGPSQQGPASFAQGLGADRGPQVRQDPRVLTRPEGGVQAELLGVQSQGRQTFRLDPPRSQSTRSRSGSPRHRSSASSRRYAAGPPPPAPGAPGHARRGARSVRRRAARERS